MITREITLSEMMTAMSSALRAVISRGWLGISKLKRKKCVALRNADLSSSGELFVLADLKQWSEKTDWITLMGMKSD